MKPFLLLSELLTVSRAEQALLQQSSTLRIFSRDVEQAKLSLQQLQQPLESTLLDSASIEQLSVEPLADNLEQKLATRAQPAMPLSENQEALNHSATANNHKTESERQAITSTPKFILKQREGSSHKTTRISEFGKSSRRADNYLTPEKQKNVQNGKPQTEKHAHRLDSLHRTSLKNSPPLTVANSSARIRKVSNTTIQSERHQPAAQFPLQTIDSSSTTQPPPIDRKRASQRLQQRADNHMAASAWNQRINVDGHQAAGVLSKDKQHSAESAPERVQPGLEQQIELRLNKLLPSGKRGANRPAVSSAPQTFFATETKNAATRQHIDAAPVTTPAATTDFDDSLSQPLPAVAGQRQTGLRGLAALADETAAVRQGPSPDNQQKLPLPAQSTVDNRNNIVNTQASTVAALTEILAAEARQAGIDLDEVGP